MRLTYSFKESYGSQFCGGKSLGKKGRVLSRIKFKTCNRKDESLRCFAVLFFGVTLSSQVIIITVLSIVFLFFVVSFMYFLNLPR